jgi:hypothetical protein
MAFERLSSVSSLDGALAELEEAGPVLANGLTNHAPMVAEVFSELGRTAELGPWLAEYASRLSPWPPAKTALPPSAWQSALGKEDRLGDLRRLLGVELTEQGAEALLARWLPRLLPGYISAAMHGVIRTAHAARSLRQQETPERATEVADALAYWASAYQALPRGAQSSTVPLPLDRALSELPLLPPGRRRAGGNISASLAPLFAFQEFELHAERLHVSDPDVFLSQLTEAFARIYLENAHDGFSTIVFIHAVTGPAALRLLLPYLSAEDARAAAWQAWQAAAALYSTFGVARPGAKLPPSEPWEVLIERAILGRDEHAIKFVEACRREARHAEPLGMPTDAYAAAATRAVAVLARQSA